MTTAYKTIDILSKPAHDAIVDKLRACKNDKEILDFERWFNSKIENGSLSELICELLRNRSISRGLAAKCLLALLNDRDNKIKDYI